MKHIEKRLTERKATKKTVVLYHANCADGFGAAFAAWKKFGATADYIPVTHQGPVPKGLYGKVVYTVDFTYPLETTEILMRNNARVTAIDHHISSRPVTEKTENFLYAVDHSGAVLSWMYFHPKTKIPTILQYIEDTDIWKFKLPRSKELFAYLDLFDFSFEKWNMLMRGFERPHARSDYAKKGALLLRHEEKLIERLVANNAEIVEFEGYRVYAVNSPLFQSEIGHVLSLERPPLAIIWSEKEQRINVSLRSDGSIDVSEIAKRFGGGGHRAAAGFSISADENIPWKRIKK